MKKTLFFLFLAMVFSGILNADYFIDFEAESKGAYGAAPISLNGLDWNMNETLIGNLAADKKNGNKSARFRFPASMTMLEDKSDGIGTISLYYAKYGTDSPAPTYRVEYSTDGGSNWTQAGNDFDSNLQASLTYWSADINASGAVRVRIVCVSGEDGKRGNIDDILMTDYSGGSPVIPDAPVATVATGITGSGFRANWQTSSGANGYNLYITQGGSAIANFDPMIIANGAATYYDVTALTSETDYAYYLTAYSDAGTSTNSNIIEVTTQDPYDGYYDTAEGLSGSYLKDELHSIIDGHTFINYDGVKLALQVLDEDPENSSNVIGLYSGWSIAKTNFNTSNGWNREHVWAKSHGNFDIDESPGTDLHHLRPEDSTVNTVKYNRDFDEGGSQYIDGDGATDCYYTTDTWEPRDEVKGDVARMMFYMDVRYEGDSGEVDLELVDAVDTDDPDTGDYLGEHGRLTTLLRWHFEDPVSAEEQARNQLIYTNYQHNRNPFIDHPEYVSEIWGTPLLLKDTSEMSFDDVVVGETSGESTFDIMGVELYGDVTITAPEGFEIATSSGGSFSSQIVLSPTSREVYETIYVRFSPSEEMWYSGTITCVSYQADQEDIAVSGNGIVVQENELSAIINEWSQGDGGSKEWVEIVVVQDNLDMRGWQLADDSNPYCTFIEGADSPWASVPEGTVIVIYNGGDRDTNLPVDDIIVVGDGNHQVVTAHNEASLFTDSSWGGFSNSTSSDNPILTNGSSRAVVHDWDQGNDSAFTSIRPGSSTGIFYTGNSAEGATSASNWTSAPATSEDITPSNGNGGSNSEWLDETLPVVFSSFTAVVSAKNEVTLKWITQSEEDMLGYNLLRAEASSYESAVSINTGIIPAENQVIENRYLYTDVEVQHERTYFYWLEAVSAGGHCDFYGPVEVTVTEDDPNQIPDIQMMTELGANFPNPFNPSTAIAFSLEKSSKVTIDIYNLKGQHIKTLLHQQMNEGSHIVQWNGKDENGKPAGSGIYFYKMKAGDYTSTRKMLLMK